MRRQDTEICRDKGRSTRLQPGHPLMKRNAPADVLALNFNAFSEKPPALTNLLAQGRTDYI